MRKIEMKESKLIPLVMILALYVLIAAAYFIARRAALSPLFIVLKALPVALLLVFVSWRTGFERLIAMGLALSIVGDVLLETPLKPAGILAFMAANACYVFAFTGKSKKLALIPGIVSYGYGIAGVCLLGPFMGKLLIPIIVYMLVVVTMLWRAWAQAGSGRRARMAFIGAILFVISDTILAYGWFIRKFPFSAIILMCAYWGGQFLIFLTASKTGWGDDMYARTQ